MARGAGIPIPSRRASLNRWPRRKLWRWSQSFHLRRNRGQRRRRPAPGALHQRPTLRHGLTSLSHPVYTPVISTTERNHHGHH
nr:MAG TPA: hypothetical protein [Caudoviricetes sp.]